MERLAAIQNGGVTGGCESGTFGHTCNQNEQVVIICLMRADDDVRH